MQKLFLAMITLSSLHSQASTTECLVRMGLAMAEEAQTLNTNYRKIEHGQEISNGNNSGIYPGSKDIGVLVVHGFTASPFEVNLLAKTINEQGFTVYLPVVAGFASNSAVANKYSYHDWRRSVAKAVQNLETCFEKIILVGFSNGGGLVTDYLLTTRDPKVKGVVALSPYFKTSVPAAGLLNAFVDLFTDSLNYKLSYTLTHHSDLQAMQIYPEHYTEGAPTKAVKSILEYGERLRENTTPPLNVPILLSYSMNDKTIDGDFALDFINQHFNDVEVFVFPKNQKVNHHIVLPIANNKPEQVFARAIQFLQKL